MNDNKYFEIVYVTKDTFVATMENVKSILSHMVKDKHGTETSEDLTKELPCVDVWESPINRWW